MFSSKKEKAKKKAAELIGTVFDIVGGAVHKIYRPLPNRGQSSAAGFTNTKNGSNMVIKKDPPGVCLAESIGGMKYNPRTHKPGSTEQDSEVYINKAEVRINKTPEGKHEIVSIQSEFQANNPNRKQFSEYLYGHPREPKTLVNEDCTYEKEINAKIGKMSLEAKRQLAQAIFNSQLNGDESIHSGQFLITSTGEGADETVTEICRYDFGAAGRFAAKRQENPAHFDPLHTSELYVYSSGQIGKDYVHYLNQDPKVREELLELWCLTDVTEVSKMVVREFNQQMVNLGILPENTNLDDQDFNNKVNLEAGPLSQEQQRQALTEYYTELKRGVKTEKQIASETQGMTLQQLYQIVGTEVKVTTAMRCSKMKEKALEHKENPENIVNPTNKMKQMNQLIVGVVRSNRKKLTEEEPSLPVTVSFNKGGG